MISPRPATWQTIMEKTNPELLNKVTGVREAVLVDGALSVKTKTLMMMFCDALLNHPDGVANIAKRAQDLEASDAELMETLAEAFLMGGMPGLASY